MFGIIFFIVFLLFGFIISNSVFHEHKLYIRVWIGLLSGILLLMWGVVPFSFLFGFTVKSHIFALAACAGLTLAVYLKYRKSFNLNYESDGTDITLYCLLIPVSALIILLLNSHILAPVNGGFYTGQSTYGDLPIHLSFITNMAESGRFPPHYPILPTKLLSYPFLVDSLSSSLYLFGTPLRWAVLIPSYVLVIALVSGLFIFSHTLLRNKAKSVIAAILFLFNGGFGFIYFLDDLKANPHNFTRIFTEWYKTPTNYTDLSLRWVNTICDMIIPQRTTMAGWAFLFLALWLLYSAVQKGSIKYFVSAGILTGLMPMIHTHSFLALSIMSLSWCLVFSLRCSDKRKYVIQWAYFAVPAAIFALPQLLFWTFPQASGGGYVRISPDWVNTGDNWLWFWIKNVGVVFVLLIPALLAASRRMLAIYSGAAALFIIADFIVFQPLAYDNNKLFYVWYLFSALIVSSYMVDVFRRLRANKGRWALAVIMLFLCLFSAGLTIGREINSGGKYPLFDQTAVVSAEFVKSSTPKDALFLTGEKHGNPVYPLAGRDVFLGPAHYFKGHGLKDDERQKDFGSIINAPQNIQKLADKYKIDYLYYGSQEYKEFGIPPEVLKKMYPVVFNDKDVYIFALSERAKIYR